MFQTHNGLVFRTAYRITGNAADAEDVLQTVFLRMLRRDHAARALENQES
jgi:RNA polymerase sigma-70 factor, ECF subfamily